MNQRGQTEYTGVIYGIDRWSGKWTGDGSITLENTGTRDGCITIFRSGYSGHLVQKIENPQAFIGKTVTAAVLAKNEQGGSTRITINNGSSYITSKTVSSLEYTVITASATIPDDVTELFVNIESNNAKISRVFAVKLELGSQQTLAHQDASGNWVLNDPPPNKAVELLKCQRYYRRIKGQILVGTVFDWDGEKLAYCPFRYPVRMRTTPNIALNGTVYARTGNAVTSSEALASIDGPSDESVMLWIKCADSAEAGMAATVYLDGDAYIEFNSEL